MNKRLPVCFMVSTGRNGFCKELPTAKFLIRLGNCLINGLIFRLKLIHINKLNKNYSELNII